MPIPSSGEIGLLTIQNEFGTDGVTALSDYYRGGFLVTGTSVNLGIPLSGEMGISNFYGAAEFMRLQGTILDLTAENTDGPCICRVEINTSGTIVRLTNGDSVFTNYGPEYWGTPTTLISAGDLYEARVTVSTCNYGGATNYSFNALGNIVTYPTAPFLPGYQTPWTPTTATLAISCRAGVAAAIVEFGGVLEFRKKYATGTTTSTSFFLSAESNTPA